jgi:hypothetical protein
MPGRLTDAVGVDLLGGREVSVAEDDLGIPNRHAEVLEQRRCRVSYGVNADLPEFGLVTDAREGADKVARLDRPPSDRRPGTFTEVDECCLIDGQAADVFS